MKKIISSFVLVAMAIYASALSASDYPLLPKPQTIEFGKSTFRIKNASVDMPAWQKTWESELQSAGITPSPKARFSIKGEIVTSIPDAPDNNDEAYSMSVSVKGIKVKAVSEKGLYWALQTLMQLAKDSGKLPTCEIIDWPAFPWRGFMMDTGRSYISPEELKREISIMSRFKLNVFHWHLTENQAWRLESKIFPMLNDSVNMERQPGLYYTVEQAKEIMKFAKDHNVLLIPEIDMPGHSAAFVRTFRHDMQSPEGAKILKLLVEEACETFDSVPYLHIGTDEVRFTNPDFVPDMVSFVKSLGKKIISWNPGWNYNKGDIDLTTMWSYRGKPTPGIPAIDLRYHYINHFDIYADLIALYRSNIYGQKKAGEGIAGVEIALWNDRYIDNEQSLIAQNSVYTAMLAIADRSWRGGGEEYFDRLGTRLKESETEDFADFTDFENRLLWHKDHTLDSIFIPYVRQTNVKWRITDQFPNNGNLSAVFPPETEGPKESYTYNGTVYNTTPANGAGIYLRHVWGESVPAFYEKPLPNHTAYAYTWVYAPQKMEVGLQAETQNYSRSESDLPPKRGKWDYRESKFWINGKELPAPEWTSVHTERTNEITLGNENFAARPVIPVTLDKGWNQVMIKLPVGKFQAPETRLVKWMFSFVFTTPDGRHAAPGLIYSPDKQLQ